VTSILARVRHHAVCCLPTPDHATWWVHGPKMSLGDGGMTIHQPYGSLVPMANENRFYEDIVIGETREWTTRVVALNELIEFASRYDPQYFQPR
jgi:hypothetical protein